jgi:AcrR family transcriptional regulator
VELPLPERGAHPTAIADVLADSGAPRGSAYHHFPGGRTQLRCEAVDYADERVAEQIEQAPDSLALLDGLFAGCMTADGIDAERAAELAMLLLTSFEGGIVVARAARDVGPPGCAGGSPGRGGGIVGAGAEDPDGLSPRRCDGSGTPTATR